MPLAIIRHLIDNKLTTPREIEQITERGSSTVYRWLNGESEPYYRDIYRLVRNLKKPEARRTLIGMLASDLPIVIDFLPEEMDAIRQHKLGEEDIGQEALDRSLLALECMAHILIQQRDAAGEESVTEESYLNVVKLIDDAIHYLTNSKNMLCKLVPRSVKARKSTKGGSCDSQAQ